MNRPATVGLPELEDRQDAEDLHRQQPGHDGDHGHGPTFPAAHRPRARHEQATPPATHHRPQRHQQRRHDEEGESIPPPPGHAVPDHAHVRARPGSVAIAKLLPDNPRAVLLAARLGWIHLVDRIHLLGDLLITGADDCGNDTDIPYALVEAAHRTGLLPCHCDHP